MYEKIKIMICGYIADKIVIFLTTKLQKKKNRYESVQGKYKIILSYLK